MAKTVLVTGGTGYIGGELIDQLLAGGHTVHTTVRDSARSEPRLRNRWPDAGDRLYVFQADLENDAGWGHATAGCDAVAHVASPFPVEVPDHEDELIVPARDGALRALRFAHEAGVTTFVLTSSAAAIAYGQKGQTNFDHTDWTNVNGDNVPPYQKSKTIAELEARDWAEKNAPDMAFCSVNPVAVFGPVENDDLSTSILIIKMMMNGSIPLMPDMGIGVIDVRDVARAHVLAIMADPDTIRGGRFPVQDEFLWMREIGDILRERVPDLAGKVAKRRMPNFMVKTLAPVVKEMKQIRGELGRVRDVDSSNTKDVLGMDFIPAAQCLEDTARSLKKHGLI